jgi:predicted DNA-binding protein YlxM (UPF0122 family)
MKREKMLTVIERRKWIIANKDKLPSLSDIAFKFSVTEPAIREDVKKFQKYETTYNNFEKLNKSGIIPTIVKYYLKTFSIDETKEKYNLDHDIWQLIRINYISDDIVKEAKENKKIVKNKNISHTKTNDVWNFSGENYDIPPAKYRMSAITDTTCRVGCAAEMVVDFN